MDKPEPVMLAAQDGIRIAGDHFSGEPPRSAALLLHMMPSTKDSWPAFASRLSALGIASLAIDLRGHGASGLGPYGYRAFDDAAHRAKRLDVEAGLAWLRERHPGLPLLAVGASIGANLALRATAEHDDIAAVLALSPGLEYHGVAIGDVPARLRPGQRALLAASREDGYAFESVEALKAMETRAKIGTIVLDGASHGTDMFTADPAFAERAAAWLGDAV